MPNFPPHPYQCSSRDFPLLPVVTRHLALKTVYGFGMLTSMLTRLLLAVVLVSAVAVQSHAADLKPETADAWKAYVQMQNASTVRAASTRAHFLEVDDSAELRARLRGGEIVVHPAQGKGVIDVPSGLIHEWVGLVFIPHRSITEVLATTRSYQRYPEYYDPAVLQAKLLHRADEADEFSMLLKKKVLTVDAALSGQYHSTFHQLDDTHWYVTTVSERLQEILNYGRGNQKTFAPDHGNGFIWRLQSITRYEAADGGVYLQLETLALSRGVPASLSWIVNPIVAKVSRAALTTTLVQTRDALSASTVNGSLLASSKPQN
jgi:hypothetical protein